MLTEFQASTSQGAVLPFPFDSFETGFSVQDISGLDPVPAEITSAGYAGKDGEQYYSSRRGKRNIILKIGLEVDYSTQTARQLRDQLYSVFMPKSEVSLSFLHDMEADVEIDGRVESFSCPMFTDKPVATISILNFDSDFIDPNTVRFVGTSSADIVDNAIDYNGTIETGFLFQLYINRDVTQLSIKNTPPDGNLRSMDISATFMAGDVLEVSTISGAKSITLIRQGLRVSYLYALSSYADWLQLFPGVNNFRVTVTGDPIGFSLDYNERYGGL